LRRSLLEMRAEASDDAVTLAALGVLAFILADVSHEILGHAVVALATGVKLTLLTTCYVTNRGDAGKLIRAAGGLANVCVGIAAFLLIRVGRPRSPHRRYFLVLSVAFNLFFAAGYPFYSGVALFGDWAAVISGLSPGWFWRSLLVLISVAGYWFSMVLVARLIRPFCGSAETRGLTRLRRMTLIPYLAAMVAACMGGAVNPAGWPVILTSALPAAGAAFGLTQMDHFQAATSADARVPAIESIARNWTWIGTAGAVLAWFVVVLGRGIRISP